MPSTRSKVVLKAGKLGVPPTLGRGAATRRTVSTLGGGVKGVISGGGGDDGSGTLTAWESWDDTVEGKEVAVVDIDVGGVEVVLREVKPKDDTIDFNDSDDLTLPKSLPVLVVPVLVTVSSLIVTSCGCGACCVACRGMLARRSAMSTFFPEAFTP